MPEPSRVRLPFDLGGQSQKMVRNVDGDDPSVANPPFVNLKRLLGEQVDRHGIS